jgi:hypothetical protein
VSLRHLDKIYCGITAEDNAEVLPALEGEMRRHNSVIGASRRPQAHHPRRLPAGDPAARGRAADGETERPAAAPAFKQFAHLHCELRKFESGRVECRVDRDFAARLCIGFGSGHRAPAMPVCTSLSRVDVLTKTRRYQTLLRALTMSLWGRELSSLSTHFEVATIAQNGLFQNQRHLTNLPITSPIGWGFTDRWSQFGSVDKLG